MVYYTGISSPVSRHRPGERVGVFIVNQGGQPAFILFYCTARQACPRYEGAFPNVGANGVYEDDRAAWELMRLRW